MKISKEKLLTIVIPAILIVLLLVILAVNLFGGVKQTKTSITHEAGRELKLDVADFFKVNEETAGNITLDTTKVDVKKPGSYEVTATYKMHEYKITVNVQDTTAPAVEFNHRYVFTNDVTKLDAAMYVDSVYDASEYSIKLARFEKSGNLEVLDEKALKSLTAAIALPCNQEELKNLGTESVPTEEGIYRAVVSATDTYGNVQLEELYVILDTTGAKIEDTEDQEITVSKEQLEAEPAVNTKDYTIIDNVDRKVSADDIEYTLELRDAQKHEWIVHVLYEDRAGNESTADFLIVVKEESKPADDDKNNQDNNQTENDKPSDDKKPEDDKNSEDDKTPGNDKTPEDNKNSADDKDSDKNDSQTPDDTNKEEPEYTFKELDKTMYTSAGVNVRDLPSADGNKLGRLDEGAAVKVTGQCNETNWYRIEYNNKVGYVSNSYLTDKKPVEDEKEYDPADTNKDGVVDTDEGMRYITPEKQACIDAGYGNVVELEPGKKYAVLMRSSDDTINGMSGFQILIKYLYEHNLDGHVGGAWIRSDEELYWYMASNCYVSYQNPDTPEYWEENDFYYDEENDLLYNSYEDWINGNGF